ncbi:MAG: DUF167 domain-containing protein [Pyrinomonadaceae bacterium]|nr:DUF167 domain-containing protein [Pyrinomonadaceae bacterium]
MIAYTESRQGIVFKVQVVPRAARSEIVGEQNGNLRVRLATVDGAANEALIRTLAMAFKVSRRAVQITAGHTSKLKQVGITGAVPEALAALTRGEH